MIEKYDRPKIDKKDKSTNEIDTLKKYELQWIKTRREAAGFEGKDLDKEPIGLALSGGGIRSATFNLGLLQALKSGEILKQVDYLSTVSGGGYIGSSFTWLKSFLNPNEFPFGSRRKHHDDLGGKVLAWLLGHCKYLTPDSKMNIWSLTAAVLTGIIINLLILIPVFLMFNFLFSQTWFHLPFFQITIPGLIENESLIVTGFTILTVLGLLFFIAFFIAMLCFVCSSNLDGMRSYLYLQQTKLRSLQGKFLMFSVLFLLVGTIPQAHYLMEKFFDHVVKEAIAGLSLSGVISFLGGLFGKKKENETRGWRSFLLSFGLALLVYGLFLLFYHLTRPDQQIIGTFWLIGGIIVSFIFALLANVNHVSMHRYYRNRLMEAFMPRKSDLDDSDEVFVTLKKAPGDLLLKETKLNTDPDKFYLHKIPVNDAPYHIVNTNIQTVGSKNPKLRGRGGDSFILSPLYCGARSTGYCSSKDYDEGQLNLATAFSISGAAVDPNTFATRSKPLSFIMTLLNVRLGYWIVNPRYAANWYLKKARPLWYFYMFSEMLGDGLNEKANYIHLSDGGHFENLGLYELIRRKCKKIIISDAGADKDYKFGDLAKVIEMVRLDFGVKIVLNVDTLRPDEKTNRSASPIVKGEIFYGDEEKAEGTIWYIKTTLTDGMPEDINSYRRDHKDYPDESTADQFYDERQFEAYRELGYRIGSIACDNKHEANLCDIGKP